MKPHHIILLALLILLPNRAVSANQLPVIGAVETLHIVKQSLQMPARIDTGAQTCSLSAVGIQPFERDGKSWLRFQVKEPATDKLIEMERPLERKAKIKRHGALAEERFVVQLQVKIGTIQSKCDFTLIDRSDYTYPALIGRNFLDGKAVVDVSHKYLAHPLSQGEPHAN